MKKIFKKIDKSKPVFFDIESHGFYMEICLAQFYQEGWKKALVVEYPDPKDLVKFVQHYHTVAFNYSYDLGTIAHQAGNVKLGTDFKIDDLFYATRTAYPEFEKYSLDYVHDNLRMSFYDRTLDKTKMQKSFATALAQKVRKATQEQIAYAKADVYTLAELWKNKEIQKVIATNKAYKLDVRSLLYSVNYQQNGIPVDREALKKERAELVDKIAANVVILDGLNPRSPKQVCEALGTANSNKDTLVRLMAAGNVLAKAVYEQRRLLKADKMLETWDFPRVHTFFNPAGTITGRFSASGGDVGQGYVNTQQISRQYQYMFYNINPKMTTFEIDFSTAELRAGCSIMNDKAMYRELMDGKDLHIEAAKLTGIQNPSKADRQKGKAVSFGLIFSMSAPSFKDYAFVNYGVKFSDRKSRRIHGAYHNKYHGISAYHDFCWNNYKTYPFKSAMGRRNVCRLGTDASNYSTQSSIAEATKLSAHFLIDKYPESIDLIINIIHDAIVMDVPTKDFSRWERRLNKAMQKGWKEVCKSDLFHFKDIPMPCETDIIKDL